jgi:hypothetical protein
MEMFQQSDISKRSSRRGHSTTQVTEAHYESRLPEVALGALKQLEAKSLSK